MVNGTAHLFIYEKDINPNSSSYGSYRWTDVGPSDQCNGVYFNSIQSQSFTRNNCPAGYTGSTVTYTVPAGTYSSSVSPTAADQLALNDIAANGQNYANMQGTCTATGGCPPYCENTPNFKCINNVCEMGIRVNTGSYYSGHDNIWVCIFHYEFSDQSWSIELTEEDYGPPCQF
jgi:hypothetical protein